MTLWRDYYEIHRFVARRDDRFVIGRICAQAEGGPANLPDLRWRRYGNCTLTPREADEK